MSIEERMTDCKRCVADPQPEGYGDPRKCAFKSGVFDSDNWACATMNVLRYIVTDAFHEDDERLSATSFQTPDWNGILVLQTYKWRGRIQGATVFNTSGGGHVPLTILLAEQIISDVETRE